MKGASDGLLAKIHERWAQLGHPGLRKIHQRMLYRLWLWYGWTTRLQALGQLDTDHKLFEASTVIIIIGWTNGLLVT